MAITKDEETWEFTCELPRCEFVSSQHPTKASAEARRSQHMAEHEGITADADRSK